MKAKEEKIKTFCLIRPIVVCAIKSTYLPEIKAVFDISLQRFFFFHLTTFFKHHPFPVKDYKYYSVFLQLYPLSELVKAAVHTDQNNEYCVCNESSVE